jgi:hypothetical protein
LTLLGSLDALASIGSFLRLLPLLISLLRCRLSRLLFFRFARLFTTKLLPPFLFLLGFDLREEIASGSDLVAYGQGAGFPVVWDNEELGIELFKDGRGSSGPGGLVSCQSLQMFLG